MAALHSAHLPLSLLIAGSAHGPNPETAGRTGPLPNAPSPPPPPPDHSTKPHDARKQRTEGGGFGGVHGEMEPRAEQGVHLVSQRHHKRVVVDGHVESVTHRPGPYYVRRRLVDHQVTPSANRANSYLSLRVGDLLISDIGRNCAARGPGSIVPGTARLVIPLPPQLSRRGESVGPGVLLLWSEPGVGI